MPFYAATAGMRMGARLPSFAGQAFVRAGRAAFAALDPHDIDSVEPALPHFLKGSLRKVPTTQARQKVRRDRTGTSWEVCLLLPRMLLFREQCVRTKVPRPLLPTFPPFRDPTVSLPTCGDPSPCGFSSCSALRSTFCAPFCLFSRPMPRHVHATWDTLPRLLGAPAHGSSVPAMRATSVRPPRFFAPL